MENSSTKRQKSTGFSDGNAVASSSKVIDASSKVRRPMNCFILYRTEKLDEGVPAPEITAKWNSLAKEHPVKQDYARRAAHIAQKHKEKNPDYVYHPERKKVKGGGSTKNEVIPRKPLTPAERERQNAKNDRQNAVRRAKRRAEVELQRLAYLDTSSRSTSVDIASAESSDQGDLHNSRDFAHLDTLQNALTYERAQSSATALPTVMRKVLQANAHNASPVPTILPVDSTQQAPGWQTINKNPVQSKQRRIFEIVKFQGINVLQERPFPAKYSDTQRIANNTHYGSIYKELDIPEDYNSVLYGPYDDRVLLTDQSLDTRERAYDEETEYMRGFYQLERERYEREL